MPWRKHGYAKHLIGGPVELERRVVGVGEDHGNSFERVGRIGPHAGAAGGVPTGAYAANQ